MGRAIYISGFAERPISNVTMRNVAAKAKTGFSASHVDGLALRGVAVEAAEGPAFDWGRGVTNRKGGLEGTAP